MNSVMWVIFLIMLGVLAIALVWLVWRLHIFSRSHNQHIMDDRLMEAMLKDAAFSQDMKHKIVKSKASVLGPEASALPEEEAQNDEVDGTTTQGAILD